MHIKWAWCCVYIYIYINLSQCNLSIANSVILTKISCWLPLQGFPDKSSHRLLSPGKQPLKHTTSSFQNLQRCGWIMSFMCTQQTEMRSWGHSEYMLVSGFQAILAFLTRSVKGCRRNSLKREGCACWFSTFSHVPCPLCLVATKRDVIFLISALDKVD